MQDLGDPVTGMYSFKPALDKRIAFLAQLINSLETKPTGYVPSSILTLQVWRAYVWSGAYVWRAYDELNGPL